MILAELLGLPHATIIMEVEKLDAAIRVKRELEDGWFQHVEMPLPALLTIQSGISKLRYATLMGIKKAKTKEIRRVTPAALGVGAAFPGLEIARVYPCPSAPSARSSSKAIPGSRSQAGGEAAIRGARSMSVLAILEQRAGEWNRMSFEAISAAQRLRVNWERRPSQPYWDTA